MEGFTHKLLQRLAELLILVPYLLSSTNTGQVERLVDNVHGSVYAAFQCARPRCSTSKLGLCWSQVGCFCVELLFDEVKFFVKLLIDIYRLFVNSSLYRLREMYS